MQNGYMRVGIAVAVAAFLGIASPSYAAPQYKVFAVTEAIVPIAITYSFDGRSYAAINDPVFNNLNPDTEYVLYVQKRI